MTTDDPDGTEPSGAWHLPPAPPPPPPPPPPQPPFGGQQPPYGQQYPPYGGHPQGQPAGAYGYGYPAYPPPQTEGTAIGALIAAAAAWVVCPVIPAIVALVLASTARRKIADSGGRLTGGGLVTAARWVAGINLVLVGGAILVAIIALVVSSAGNEPDSFQFERLLSVAR